jgi:hypothetical protein
VAKPNKGGGGSSHQRTVRETAGVSPKVVPHPATDMGTSNRPSAVDGKSLAVRLVDFLEHPWMLAVFGVIGGIVGLIYTPALFLLAAVMVGAFHRAKVVTGLGWKIQLFCYVVIFAVSIAITDGTVALVKKSAHIPTASEIASDVIAGLRTPNEVKSHSE